MASLWDTDKEKAIEAKITEARAILKALGMPTEQHNDRSGKVLLGLLGLQPNKTWAEAGQPLMGVRPIMDFVKAHYNGVWAENTRETIRRRTLHQFVDGAVAVLNPDSPTRATNSPKSVYQVSPEALSVIRTYDTPAWLDTLASFKQKVEGLKTHYEQAREREKIAIQLPDGHTLSLTPGGQNVLIEKIITDMLGYFAPACRVLYVGDTGDKHALYARDELRTLGVEVADAGKMPDVIAHFAEKDWLLLIEAVTSHGPVDAKRRDDLKRLFAGSKIGLVYVTAFLSRRDMVKYLDAISWETEVWVAEAPTHMIHFNGERFLGPYDG